MDNFAKKILWKCRRGSLELDLILHNFYEKKFADLTPQQQQIFDELLDEQDPILTDWFFGTAQPIRDDFINLIRLIKNK